MIVHQLNALLEHLMGLNANKTLARGEAFDFIAGYRMVGCTIIGKQHCQPTANCLQLCFVDYCPASYQRLAIAPHQREQIDKMTYSIVG